MQPVVAGNASDEGQPRKRKDKNKRKAEEVEVPAPSEEDDIVQVQQDDDNGGGIFSKVLFCILFSAVIVLIGLIIKGNRAPSEPETTEPIETDFTQLIQGRVDKDVEKKEYGYPPAFRSDEGESDELNNQAEEDVDDDVEEFVQRNDEEEEEEEDEEEEKVWEKKVWEEEKEERVQEEEKEKEEDEDGVGVEVPFKPREPRPATIKFTMSEIDYHNEYRRKSDLDIADRTIASERNLIEELRDAADVLKPSSEPSSDEGDESDSDMDDRSKQANITSTYDFAITGDLDAAEEHLRKSAAFANELFETLIEEHPRSPRALYGKARAVDLLAEEHQSNELLKQALGYYLRALNAPDVPDELFRIIAEKYIDRARFMGQYKKAIGVHWQLVERFPDNASYLNNLAVTYLTINLVEEARFVLKRVLARWPDDGFALVHYGFILKTADNNLEESIDYLDRGIKSGAPGVIDGRFYFQLGDALARLNRQTEAEKLYEEGVQRKVFLSKYQRSLYNVERLMAKPWWVPDDIPDYRKLIQALKTNYKSIRKEGLSALNDLGYFQDEAENLKDTGTWKQFELFARGHRNQKNCLKSPVTCALVEKFTEASGCKRGQIKFSVMHPGTHVWPHCGPTNCRLRIHLGLKVPEKTFIRVAEETRSWTEGDVIIFDDSFEHEVWHNGSDFRLVLIVDVWHPDLTLAEKRSLSPI